MGSKGLTPIRAFVAVTLLLRDAPMSSATRASALSHLEDLANHHRSPGFCRRLDDFMARFSQHGDVRAKLEPLVSALKALQSQEPDPSQSA